MTRQQRASLTLSLLAVRPCGGDRTAGAGLAWVSPAAPRIFAWPVWWWDDRRLRHIYIHFALCLPGFTPSGSGERVLVAVAVRTMAFHAGEGLLGFVCHAGTSHRCLSTRLRFHRHHATTSNSPQSLASSVPMCCSHCRHTYDCISEDRSN